MSDHPRTAACVIRRLSGDLVYHEGMRIVPAQEMAKLERELVAMTKERDELIPWKNLAMSSEMLLVSEKKRAEENGKMAHDLGIQLHAMTKERDALRDALMRLHDAADAYAACQDDVRDERYGNVQPITAQEGRELNEALAAADKLLTKTNP